MQHDQESSLSLPPPLDEMVLKLEQRNFGEAGPLEVIRLNLGPSGLHIEQLLILRNKVKEVFYFLLDVFF